MVFRPSLVIDSANQAGQSNVGGKRESRLIQMTAGNPKMEVRVER